MHSTAPGRSGPGAYPTLSRTHPVAAVPSVHGAAYAAWRWRQPARAVLQWTLQPPGSTDAAVRCGPPRSVALRHPGRVPTAADPASASRSGCQTARQPARVL